jgi:hypothetical protein
MLAVPVFQWPRCAATTLTGKALIVPRDLGPLSVLVVGFTKASRDQTEAWSRRLRSEGALAQKAQTYDVMVFDDVPRFVRSLVLRQVIAGVPAARQDRFLVVTEQVDTWRKILQVGAEDDAYIALVASSGNVLWRGHGKLTEAAFAELMHTLP